ncbi:DUF3572 domain-containing protein [Neorhizobium alkalisoli]|uniref:DUF3572 domain-containing protein n=1 Tax=Neorhizobium alkalisoli TaxID=528178 RepID=UPI000CF8A802|nr:DUF3572 domain-containing protein [Neorhizobium alkalisoli]
MRREPTKTNTSAANAEETAAAVLGWLANEPEMLGRFLALSGLQANQMRNAVNDPGFLAGMIDFLMGHEPTLLAFCEATDIKPETVAAAWQYYAGPQPGSGDY